MKHFFLQSLLCKFLRKLIDNSDYIVKVKLDLKATDIQKIKKVAAELLATLKAEKLKIDHWRGKKSTRDAVRIAIRGFLWSDKTGLPVDSYTEEEVGVKADDVFRHVYRAHPTVPSPFYVAAI